MKAEQRTAINRSINQTNQWATQNAVFAVCARAHGTPRQTNQLVLLIFAFTFPLMIRPDYLVCAQQKREKHACPRKKKKKKRFMFIYALMDCCSKATFQQLFSVIPLSLSFFPPRLFPPSFRILYVLAWLLVHHTQEGEWTILSS